MKCTFLKPLSVKREYTEAFGGYDSRARIADGCFADMKNLSSRAFPLMATRSQREMLMKDDSLQGVLVKDKAAWVADGIFHYNGQAVRDIPPIEGEKTLVSFGGKIVIFPNFYEYNTVSGKVKLGDAYSAQVYDNPQEFEREKNSFSALEYTSLPDGELKYDEEEGMPEGEYSDDGEFIPKEGSYAYYYDSVTSRRVYFQYRNGQFEIVKHTSLVIAGTSSGSKLSMDNLWLRGAEGYVNLDGYQLMRYLSWSYSHGASLTEYTGDGLFGLVVQLPGPMDDLEFVRNYLGKAYTVGRLRRDGIPYVDGIMENGNRLWGWRYGEAANGETVNEIYSTALGDPAAWNQFEGLPSDSYAVSVGSDGVFTGAAYYSGSMYFFKENCYHRIVGKKPSNYQLVTVTCTGIEIGSERSLVTAGDALYYKGKDGFYCFDGSIPYRISDALGEAHYKNAVGGLLGDRIYWDCEVEDGRVMLVYDFIRKLWYKEDSLFAREMVPAFGNLLARGVDGLYLIDGEDVDDRFSDVFEHEGEGAFEWFGELGDLGLSDVNAKYVSRLVLRTTMEKGARVTVELMRDSSGSWETVALMNAKNKETSSVPITVPRCDHFRLRISGTGGFKLWGLARDIETTNEIRR